MLHDKPPPYSVYYPDQSLEIEPVKKEFGDEENGLLPAPFPFKVAKALDPTIYRNIEYDTWIEIRRGKNSFILGNYQKLIGRSKEQIYKMIGYSM